MMTDDNEIMENISDHSDVEINTSSAIGNLLQNSIMISDI